MPEELIATLWMQLADIYGARFLSQYGEKDSGVWRETLEDLKKDDFARGLKAMLRDVRFETWPPNCTQFRHLCLKKPESNTPPSVHRAFEEARRNLLFSKPRLWSHPAVKFTVKRVGLEVVNDAHTDRAFFKFSECYEGVCKRIAEGRQVPDVPESELVIAKRQTKPVPKLIQFIKANP